MLLDRPLITERKAQRCNPIFSAVALLLPLILPGQCLARKAGNPFFTAAEAVPVKSESAHKEWQAPRETPLGQLITEALQGNPEIQAAEREREAAQQRVKPAGAFDDPMLEAGVVNLPIESLSFRREDMTMKMLGLSQKLPYPGKRRLRQDVALRDAEAVNYAYQETVNRIVRDVKVAYFDLALVMESTRLVEKNEQILEQFLDLAEARYRVGQGSESDVLKAQTQLSTIGDELIRLGRDRQAIEAELNRVLGRQAGPIAVIPEMPGLPEVPLSLDRLRESALKDRPQLLALQSLITRNEKALLLAGKAYYPDFEVRLSYGQRDDMPGGVPRDDMISLSVAVNLPVWRKTKLAPGVAEAAAMHEQVLEMYQAQQNEVSAQLRRQVADAEQDLRSARLYQTGILPQARLAVEAALAAYKVNRVDFLTLLDSQMTVFNFEITHAGAVAGYNKALAEIDLIIGRPTL